MRNRRETAWRLVGGMAAAAAIALGPIVMNIPIDTYSCATQVCPYNDWWTALLFFGCWC